MISVNVNFMVIVALAVLASMAFSMFWHSPKILGEAWARETGMDPKSCKDCGKKTLYTLFATFAMAVGLFIVIVWAGTTTAKHGALIGFWVGCSLNGMAILIPYLWEERSPKLFMISAGGQILSMILMGSIMGHLIGKFFI